MAMRRKKHNKGSKASEAVNWDDFIRVQEELRAAGKWKELLCWVIGGYTAFRVSDFCDLTWEEVMGREVLAVEEKKKKWLSASARSVVFGPEAKALIEECRVHTNPQSRPDFPLFRSPVSAIGGYKAMTRDGITKMLARVAREHNLNQQCSPHSLRKCCALRAWLRLGGNDTALMYVSKMLNHSSTEMTRRYLGITERIIGHIYRDLAKPIPESRPGFSHIEELYRQMNGVQ